MGRSSKLRDMNRFRILMNKHKLVGLCKCQPLDRCLSCSTLLTQEPSFPMSWRQIYSLLEILLKIDAGESLTDADKKEIKNHLKILAVCWKWMTEKSEQKGIVNAAMAPKPERKDGDGEDESPDAGPAKTKA